jgi:hypothetical protein
MELESLYDDHRVLLQLGTYISLGYNTIEVVPPCLGKGQIEVEYEDD